MQNVTRITAASTALLICFACSRSSPSPSTANAAAALASPGAGALPAVPFADPHQQGQGNGPQLVETSWGRLVDVYAQEPASGATVLLWSDLAIDASLASDGIDYELDQDPVTLVEELTLLHPIGSAGFDAALERARQLDTVVPKAAQVAPPFTAVPRNAALVLRFDDLFAAPSAAGAVRVITGAAASELFAARVFADPNYGVVLGGELYSTRIVIDFTTTEYEALKHGLSGALNALGLPCASTPTTSNVLVHLPNDGSTPTLTNAIGQPLVASPTQGIVRAFRSGLETDPYNGFLPDAVAPTLLAVRSVDVVAAAPLASGQFAIDVRATGSSAPVGTAGEHWLRLPGAILKTSKDAAASNGARSAASWVATNGSATSVRMTLLAGSAASVTSGPGQWIGTDTSNAAAFHVLPDPTSPPFAGASVASRVRVWLSEPTLADGAGLEGLTLRRENSLYAFDEQVIGSLGVGFDQRELTFAPATNLTHVAGQSEGYTVVIDDSLTDLAGNAMANASIGTFTLAPNQPSVTSGGLVLTFDSIDEDGNGKPEIIGNHLYNFDPRGSIRPRPVTRFSSVVDGNRPIVAPMLQFGQPIQTPLVPLGSRMHTVWRMYDLGLGLMDRMTWDVDVEGLNWAPFGGAVQADVYGAFEMRLGHSGFQPDEELNAFLLPDYPNSGLVRPFASNFVDPATEKIVHPAAAGYFVDPVDTFVSATGTPMVPWPLNEGKTPAHFVTYTWRDTGVDAVGAPNGDGVDIERYQTLTGDTNFDDAFLANQVPTIGLPLLMEFRCHADAGAFGVNGLQIALGLNSSARPFFRAFSSGGINSQGQPQTVDPDNEPMANGGFGTGGVQTMPNDNAVHFGQADFVIRVSRTLSAWFDTGSLTGATFSPAAVLAKLPEGTSVNLEFRGATDVSAGVADATLIGAYGNQDASALNQGVAVSVTFLNGDDDWKAQASDIDGARYFQFRLTHVSNIASLEIPRTGVVAVPFMR